jgi:hypothetical protein
MPDFFDRLLARSVPGFPLPPGETVVAPRLPQLFEPVGTATELDQEAVISAPAQRAPAATPAPPPPATAEVRREPVEAVPPAGPLPAVISVSTPRPAMATTVPVPVRPAPERAALPVELPREHLREEQLTKINHTVSQGEPAGTLLPSSTTVVVPASGSTPDARRASGAPGRRHDPPPPQVVRVSIGRVEVTAAGADAKPPARPTPSRPEPAISLERYLTRRDGRR